MLNQNIEKMSKKNYIERPAISRDDVLSDAVRKCLDAMYRASYPSVTLEELEKEAKKIDPKDRDEAKLFNRHYLPDILKDYFKKPIVDKWIEPKNEIDPGHRGYEHPEPMPEEHRVVAEKYLDMANDFFNWNRDLNALYFNVCNVSPCSNKDTVEKWYHEHGDPDFKIPEDDYWVDAWDETEDEDDEEIEEENGE